MGALYTTMALRAEKAPPPTTEEIWNKEGTPVTVAQVIRGDMEQTVDVTGDINALNKVALSAKIPGRVAQIHVREGDVVSPGMTVIVLDQEDAQSNLKQAEAGLQVALTRLSQAETTTKVTRIQTDAAIEQAKANLNAAEARLSIVKRPARSQELMVAENNVTSAKANLDNAQANHKRHQQLLKQGAISQSAFDVVNTQYLVAQAQHKSAQEQLSLVKEGGRQEDILAAQAQVDSAREQLRTAKANASLILLRQEDVKQARASVAQAEAALALARQQISYTVIKSPIAGKLSSRLTEPGQVVAAGQPLAEVVNLGSLYFKGDVSETELVNIRKGQKVSVRVDAVTGHLFDAVVRDIYPSGSTASRNFPVRIDIQDTEGAVRPGMFARGKIVVGSDKNVLLVPKDAIDERRGTKMVFKVGSDSKAKRYDIEILSENRDYVELKSTMGLEEGDTLVTGGRQNLQDGTRVAVRNGK